MLRIHRLSQPTFHSFPLHSPRFKGRLPVQLIEPDFSRHTLRDLPDPLDPKQDSFFVRHLKHAQTLAQPDTSNFRVGALAIGTDCNGEVAISGFNIEPKGMDFADTVHAEQAAIALAFRSGFESLHTILTTAVPCGHCRQFMLELGKPDLRIIVHEPNQPVLRTTLRELLPHPFSLSNADSHLLVIQDGAPAVRCGKKTRTPLETKAFEAAKDSYHPYPKAFAGLAITMKDGTVYSGSGKQSSAYNPSLPPLQEVLVAMVIDGKAFQDIAAVVYARTSDTYFADYRIKAFLEKFAPKAGFSTLSLEM